MSEKKTVYVVQCVNEWDGTWADSTGGESPTLDDAKMWLNAHVIWEKNAKVKRLTRWRIIKRTEEVVV